MSLPIRSLHLDTERTWRGGEQQVLYLVDGLRQRGHVAEVVGPPESPFVKRAREAGAVAHEVPLRGELSPRAIRRVAAILKAGAFDLIHAHTSHAHAIAAIAARLARPARCVVSRRVDFPIRRGPFSRMKYRFGVDRYVAISRAVRDVLVGGGVNEERIRVVPSGIDLARLDAADAESITREFGIPPGARVVGSLSWFAGHKGLEHFVDAVPAVAARHPDAWFFLVGDGEERAAIEDRARRVAPHARIRFPGFRKDALSFLARFDVVCTPSVLEGLNTTNLDALALGRPVVATAVGGIPEAVIDGETGLLVPPSAPAALAAAIERLLDEPELGARLGAAGRALVERRFTNDAMVEGTLEVYRELLRAGPTGGG